MADIVIDFGGTNTKIAFIEEGRILVKRSIPSRSDQGLLPLLPRVEETVFSIVSDCGMKVEEMRGVGVALPGIVDARHKLLRSINGKFMDAVGDFDFEGWARKAFGLRIEMENDARAALLGEVTYGVAKGIKDAVLMIFGTGIGTAAVIDGQVVRGRHDQAGILGGHFTVNVGGNRCSCGNLGCLEAEASHWALPERAKREPGYGDSLLSMEKNIDYRTVIEAVRKKDPFAERLFLQLINIWSAGIVTLIHAYDPEVVILSGGLMKSRELVLPLIEERVHTLAWTPWGKVHFRVAEDPEASVLFGLSSLLDSPHESRV